MKVITIGDYYDTLVVLMTAQQQHIDADTMARTISLKAKKATRQYIIKVITIGDYYDTLVVLMTAQQQHMDADTMARTISLKANNVTSL